MVHIQRDLTQDEEEYFALLARWGRVGRQKSGKRGQIDHFSRASRYRMLSKLGRVGRTDPPFMLTLTYRSGGADVKKAKRDLVAFTKWMNRNFGTKTWHPEEYTDKNGFDRLRKKWIYTPEWGGIWRYEETTGKGTRALAKTPHFHILVWFHPWFDLDEVEMEDLRLKLATKWGKVTGDLDDDRLAYGVHLKRSNGDQARMKNYLLGHHGKKTDQEACNAGRHWGIVNEPLLQIGEPLEEHDLSPSQRARLARVAAKLIAKKTGRRPRDCSDWREINLVLGAFEINRLTKWLLTGRGKHDAE